MVGGGVGEKRGGVLLTPGPSNPTALMCVGCKMHLAKYCCQHLKKVERIFNAPLTKVKCKGVVKLSASSVNYKGIIATHSIGGGYLAH